MLNASMSLIIWDSLVASELIERVALIEELTLKTQDPSCEYPFHEQ